MAASQSAEPLVDQKLRNRRILVVEDDLDTRDLIRTVLERHGAEVIAVASSATALAEIARTKPDLMISDIGMTGENGYDLIKKVRALSPEEGGHVPAIALTAYAGVSDRRRALLAGEVVIQSMDLRADGGGTIDVPSARVHHWRGAIFIPGATVDRLLARLRHSPPPQTDVLRAAVLERGHDRMTVALRLRRTPGGRPAERAALLTPRGPPPVSASIGKTGFTDLMRAFSISRWSRDGRSSSSTRTAAPSEAASPTRRTRCSGSSRGRPSTRSMPPSSGAASRRRSASSITWARRSVRRSPTARAWAIRR